MECPNEVFRSERWTGRSALVEGPAGHIACVVAAEPEWLSHDVARMTLALATRLLAVLGDYRRPTTVEIRFGDDTTRMAGFVEEATIVGRRAEVTLSAPLRALEHRRSGGFASSGVPMTEVAWSLLRTSGWPEARLSVQGVRRGQAETFTVTAPVLGVEAPELFAVGPVTFTADPRVARARLPAGEPALDEAFRAGPVWAAVHVEASLCLDAERTGLRLVDAALAWLTVVHGYGATVDATGAPLPFRRAGTLSRPRRTGIAHVEGMMSRRLWLRGDDSTAGGPELGRADAVARLPLPTAPAEQLVEAALCWRRAIESNEQFAIAAALSEAVECLTASVKVPKQFTRKQLGDIRSAATELDEHQRERFESLVSTLNSPSLNMKLDHLLAELGVPHTPDELSALRLVRQARNAFVHGGERSDLDPHVIEAAVSMVARVIAWVGSAAH